MSLTNIPVRYVCHLEYTGLKDNILAGCTMCGGYTECIFNETSPKKDVDFAEAHEY